MQRYILTGAPGSGKTSILRRLEADGFEVVEEAATDVIASAQADGEDEPWTKASFPERTAAEQRRRQLDATGTGPVFFDRSPVCTYALALFLGHPVGPVLARELERVESERVYERRVLFVEHLGFVTRTRARRIGLEDAVRFERVHEAAYREFGYEPARIAAGGLAERVAAVRSYADRSRGDSMLRRGERGSLPPSL